MNEALTNLGSQAINIIGGALIGMIVAAITRAREKQSLRRCGALKDAKYLRLKSRGKL